MSDALELLRGSVRKMEQAIERDRPRNDAADFLLNARSHDDLPEGFVAPFVKRNAYDAPDWMPPAANTPPPPGLTPYQSYTFRRKVNWERENLRSWEGFEQEQREIAEAAKAIEDAEIVKCEDCGKEGRRDEMQDGVCDDCWESCGNSWCGSGTRGWDECGMCGKKFCGDGCLSVHECETDDEDDED